MVHFSPDAKALLRDEINQIRSKMEVPGFPERLQWVWSKLEAYVARLALIMAMCRVVEERAPERIESPDVLRAGLLIKYFKSHARRGYTPGSTARTGTHGSSRMWRGFCSSAGAFGKACRPSSTASSTARSSRRRRRR